MVRSAERSVQKDGQLTSSRDGSSVGTGHDRVAAGGRVLEVQPRERARDVVAPRAQAARGPAAVAAQQAMAAQQAAAAQAQQQQLAANAAAGWARPKQKRIRISIAQHNCWGCVPYFNTLSKIS